MNASKIIEMLSEEGPTRTADLLGEALKQVLPQLEEEERKTFFLDLVEDEGPEKVTSLVHL